MPLSVQILPQTLINKIAAGEVIVRPASVVKELVENSLDAGASLIRVEVSEDGRSIRITDNGCGMDEDNAKVAILRHSTSKIREFDDLERLKTRGFRGEALASIISVSRFEMLTRPHDAMSGTRLIAAGGRVERVEPVGTAPGTTIHVRDLFYNTPARLKFLKTPAAEFNVLVQIITQQALTHPGVGIACVRGGKVRFELPEGQDLLARIESLLGSALHGQLIPVDFARDNVHVTGYISRPEASRKDRRWQFLMVNGRPIAAKQLAYPIQEAYHGLLMTQRFPVVILDIGIDLIEVDINVHPTKEEVRFQDERKVAGLLHRAVVETLRSHNLMPTMNMPAPAGAPSPESEDEQDESGRTSPRAETQEMDRTREESSTGSAASYHQSGPSSQSAPRGGASSSDRQDDLSLPFVFSPKGDSASSPTLSGLKDFLRPPDQTRDLFPPSQISPPVTPRMSSPTPSVPLPAEAFPLPSGKAACEGPPRERNELSPPPRSELSLTSGPVPTALGQVGQTYVIAEWGEDLLLIDQHAAHERLVYKQLQEKIRGKIPQQPLLVPIAFEIAAADLDRLTMILPILEEMGIDIRQGEGSTFEVDALPADLDNLDVVALIQDILDDLEKNADKAAGVEGVRDFILIRMACHAAIRAGQILHPQEMAALIRQIYEAKLSFTCPHGRPTMVLLRKDQLDRQFGRK